MSFSRSLLYFGLIAGVGGAASPVLAQTEATTAAVATDAAVAADAAAATAAVEGLVVVARRNVIPNLTEIAGSASVITADQVEAGRVATVADALKFQPGLLAQSATGTEATRFSMRGSGIIRSPSAWGTGIQMLYDDLPLTTPEGSPYEYYEPLANNYIEVYRGANAFDFSPTTQGGAINYVPHTGYDSAKLLARAEFGSFGYNRQQVSSGGVIGAFDYYVSATHFATDGFRDRNRSYSQRLLLNLGYKITPRLNTRFYLQGGQQNTSNASGLTLAQIEADPTQNTTIIGNRRNVGSVLLANKTTWQISDASRLQFGVLYKNFPLRNQGGTFPGNWDVKDISAALRYELNNKLFGRPSETLVALLYSAVLPDSTNKAFNSTRSRLVQLAYFNGYDATLLVRNDLEAWKGLWVTTGLAAIEQTRKSDIVVPVRDIRSEKYSNLAPRIGLRWEPNPDLQLFGNFSRSVEAPIAHQLPQSVANIYAFNASIKEQTQNTWEIGARGQHGTFKWSLAAYRAKIKGEILTVQIAPATPTTPAVTQTNNATSPTIHQGIEAAVETVFWKDGPAGLTLRQALTLNDFHFVNDPVFKDNTLPAVPKYLYQAGLEYTHRSGVYVGGDVEASLAKYPADFANTVNAPSYVIFNARIGWQHPDKTWQVFAEVRNLTDKHYVAVVSPTFNARGVDGANYSPGQTRNFTIGITRAF